MRYNQLGNNTIFLHLNVYKIYANVITYYIMLELITCVHDINSKRRVHTSMHNLQIRFSKC